MAELLFPLQYKRQYDAPLDADLVFNTFDLMNAYLNSPLRYSGMIVSCLEDEGTIYVLSNLKDRWIPIVDLDKFYTKEEADEIFAKKSGSDLWKREIIIQSPTKYSVGGLDRGSNPGTLTVLDMVNWIVNGKSTDEISQYPIFYGTTELYPYNKTIEVLNNTNSLNSIMFYQYLGQGCFVMAVPSEYDVRKIIDENDLNIRYGMMLRTSVINNKLYRVLHTEKLNYNSELEITSNIIPGKPINLEILSISPYWVNREVLLNKVLLLKPILDTFVVKNYIEDVKFKSISFAKPNVLDIQITDVLNDVKFSLIGFAKASISLIVVKEALKSVVFSEFKILTTTFNLLYLTIPFISTFKIINNE